MDYSIVLAFNTIARTTPLTEETVVFLGSYFPYLLGILFVYVALRTFFTHRDRIIFLLEGLVAVVISRAIFVELFRQFVHRPRPFVDNPAIGALLSETSYSFPSGHATFFFALATIVYAHDKRWGILFYIASALIGLARVMAGVHYPSDILGGAILGIAVGFLTQRMFLYLNSKT